MNSEKDNLANKNYVKIEINGRKVPITAEKGSGICLMSHSLGNKRAVISSPVFQGWLKSLDPRFVIRQVDIQSVDLFGRGSNKWVGFLKIKVDVADASGNFIPGICFLRGGTAVLFPVLECQGKEYTVLVRQPRVPIGRFSFAELPAGMLDDSGTFSGAAAKEIKEETGLVFLERDLVDLTEKTGPIYFSPGGSDEAAKFFLARRCLTPAELSRLEGRNAGEQYEGERIVLGVIRLKDLPAATQDGKTLIAWALYQKYLQEAKRRIS